MARKRRRKRRRIRRRIRWRLVLKLMGAIAALVLFCYLTVILFETKKIDVTGNQYSSAQEVVDWVQSDRYSSNTLYVLWKYNRDDLKQLPAIEKTTAKLKSPWEVTIQVTEKRFSGRVDFAGELLYFDRKGIASLKSTEVIEGVPYVEGMEVNPEKVKLGKILPVTDDKVFREINSVSGLLEKMSLTSDKISCEGNNLTLHFGGIRVQMGSGEYVEKLTQAEPILVKLKELYPERTGVLHLENYTEEDSSVRFVPDAAAEGAAAE